MKMIEDPNAPVEEREPVLCRCCGKPIRGPSKYDRHPACLAQEREEFRREQRRDNELTKEKP